MCDIESGLGLFDTSGSFVRNHHRGHRRPPGVSVSHSENKSKLNVLYKHVC